MAFFRPALGGAWTVFVDRPFHATQALLFDGPVDGSLPAEQLHTPLPSWFSVDEDSVSVMADGVSVLSTIRADEVTPQGRVLWIRRIPRLFADGFESGAVGRWSGP